MNTLIKAIAALAAVISLNVSAFAADDDFSGKTMCVFGDSYVANHLRPYTEAWHSKVAERMGMKYINFGRNGSSIAFDRSKEGFGREMTERYKELPDITMPTGWPSTAAGTSLPRASTRCVAVLRSVTPIPP